MSPEDYRDTWQPMPAHLWLRYPSNRAQATVCWYAGGARPDWAPPPTFQRLPASASLGAGAAAPAQP